MDVRLRPGFPPGPFGSFRCKIDLSFERKPDLRIAGFGDRDFQLRTRNASVFFREMLDDLALIADDFLVRFRRAVDAEIAANLGFFNGYEILPGPDSVPGMERHENEMSRRIGVSASGGSFPNRSKKHTGVRNRFAFVGERSGRRDQALQSVPRAATPANE